MRIALLHYSAPPIVGGVESVLGVHAGLMASAGHQVSLLAGRGAQVDPRVSFIQIPLLDSRHPEVLSAKAELDTGQAPEEFSDLVAAIQDALKQYVQKVDVLIAHNVCSLHKNLPLTAALYELTRQSGAPQLILWHHDLAWTTPRYRAELYEGFPWDLLRRDWLHAKQVAVSELRQQELASLFRISPQRIRVIPNGVDLARFYKLEPKTRAFVEQLNLTLATPLLLLPVRITPRKNIELALRTLAALREMYPQAALVVTGPLGPHNPANVAYFTRLTDLRASLGLIGSAHFLAELDPEFLPDAVIHDFYRAADALLFPSREEGFGIPLLEAGLARLPVFCADIPPLRKLGGEWVTYFSPDADPKELASTIAGSLETNPAFRLGNLVKRQYTWERIYAEQIAPLLGKEGEAVEETL